MSLNNILLLVMISALVVLNAFLFFYYLKMNRIVDVLLKKGKAKDLREALLSRMEKVKEIELELKGVTDRMQLLEDVSKMAFQKIGVIRFNPFSGMGGNQSFVIALLNSKNNGFVISSLFIEEGNRMYAKKIVDGKSEHSLSVEEKEAIGSAIKSYTYHG